MTTAPGIPIGEIPLSLVARDGRDGQCLSWVAALARLHIGLSWTAQFGEGSVVVFSGWRAYCAATLGIMSRAAIRVKAELVEQGGVTFSGRAITVDPGPSRARSVHRGICRLMQQHIRDAGDSSRTDAVAAAVLIAMDLYVRGRHDAEGVTGEIRIDDLAATWKTESRTIAAALHRLQSNDLLTVEQGRPGGRGRGAAPMRYRLSWPAAWRGVALPRPEAAAEPPVTSMHLYIAHTTGAQMTPAWSAAPIHLQFAHVTRAQNTPASTDAARKMLVQLNPVRAEVRKTPPQPHHQEPAVPVDVAFAHQVPTPRSPNRGICAPQEISGEDDEKGGEEEMTTAALPAIPPEHMEQLGIGQALWPQAQAILDGASTCGVRLALTPHIAHVLRDLRPDQVLTAIAGHRIEDAWDLRVVLHRSKLRRDTGDLWHEDIASTLQAGDDALAALCAKDERARNEWLDVFARLGLRLSGVLAGLDHLFPRTELQANPSRYARHYATTLQTWSHQQASSAHLVRQRASGRARASAPCRAKAASGTTTPQPEIAGEVLAPAWWQRVLARAYVPGASGTPDDAATFATSDILRRDPGMRLWLTSAKIRLIRRADAVLLVVPSPAFADQIRARYWAAIQPAIEAVCGPGRAARLVGPDGADMGVVESCAADGTRPTR